jgi:hypothetical protein
MRLSERQPTSAWNEPADIFCYSHDPLERDRELGVAKIFEIAFILLMVDREPRRSIEHIDSHAPISTRSCSVWSIDAGLPRSTATGMY